MVLNPVSGHDGLQVVDRTQPYDGEKVLHEKHTEVLGGKPDNATIHEKGNEGKYSIVDREQSTPRPTKEKRILGLKRRTFFIVAAIILVVIIAAGVGGGVGGAMSKKSTDSSSSTSAPVSTTASATTLPTSSSTSTRTSGTSTSSTRTVSSATSSSTGASAPTLGAYNCPSENGTTYTSTVSQQRQAYQILCDADFPAGAAGVSGGTVDNLNTGVVATSIRACVDQCVANAGRCSAVTYTPNVTAALDRTGITGNCFLKSQRSAVVLYRTDDVQAVSAFLVTG